MRSYGRGSPEERPAPGLERRLRRLELELPEDPLESDEIVNAWGEHADDPEAMKRLRTTYAHVQQRLDEARADVEDGDHRASTELDELSDYVRAVNVLAESAPELGERDDFDAEELALADARLQGAQAPVDAAGLAGARERAREARDEAWAWALTSAPEAARARPLAESVEELFQKAESLAEDDTRAAAAFEAFLRVEELARTVTEDAQHRSPARRKGRAELGVVGTLRVPLALSYPPTSARRSPLSSSIARTRWLFVSAT